MDQLLDMAITPPFCGWGWRYDLNSIDQGTATLLARHRDRFCHRRDKTDPVATFLSVIRVAASEKSGYGLDGSLLFLRLIALLKFSQSDADPSSNTYSGFASSGLCDEPTASGFQCAHGLRHHTESAN